MLRRTCQARVKLAVEHTQRIKRATRCNRARGTPASVGVPGVTLHVGYPAAIGPGFGPQFKLKPVSDFFAEAKALLGRPRSSKGGTAPGTGRRAPRPPRIEGAAADADQRHLSRQASGAR